MPVLSQVGFTRSLKESPQRERILSMFRPVLLPSHITGKLFLHSMPGRYEVIGQTWRALESHRVGVMVCLAELDEVRERSIEYAEALDAGLVPCPVISFEIPDRDAPSDRDGFYLLACEVAERLEHGETVLVHCAGGVGRTALLAISVLLVLGHSLIDARSIVSRAGSTVETAPQSELLVWCDLQTHEQAGANRKVKN